MVIDGKRVQLPPSVTYATFKMLLGQLLMDLLAQIEMSYLRDKFSAAIGTQLTDATKNKQSCL